MPSRNGWVNPGGQAGFPSALLAAQCSPPCWTNGADHGRMTLANELGGPLIRTTYESPRLRIQPGFSSLHLHELILLNCAVPERTEDT